MKVQTSKIWRDPEGTVYKYVSNVEVTNMGLLGMSSRALKVPFTIKAKPLDISGMVNETAVASPSCSIRQQQDYG